jgi:hypothetical protein
MRVSFAAGFGFSLVCSLVAVGCGNSGPSNHESTFDGGLEDATLADSGGTDSSQQRLAPQQDGCVPKTCAELGYECGQNVDNCGSVIVGGCGQCPGGAVCGAGGFSKCGGGSDAGDAGEGGCGSGGCCPLTCADQGYNCGPAGDGCGGLIASCGACTAPETCGGGGPSVCGGTGADGGMDSCVARTCQEQGVNCGPAGDGCGNLLSCGACPPPETCGGGGTPNVCGPLQDGGDGASPCKTCAELGYQCGPAGDGCGNIIQCGACPAGQVCGAGGAFHCGPMPDACVPKTCAEQGFKCGPQDDGCGNPLDCGSCPVGQTCGGPGVNNACVASCTTCPPPTLCDVGVTSITGKIVAGTQPQYGTPDPVPNVIVYVPSGPVAPFAPGVTCEQCGADLSGGPIVVTTTHVDGTFELDGVPVTANMPLVIQLGRWRKQLVVPMTSACQNTPVGTITMPRNHAEGDIPLTAISTGNVDAMECVLLKMGIDPGEFTLPASAGGTGRVQMFVGNGSNEGFSDPKESALTTSPAALALYDEVLFPCWGDDPTQNGSPNAKTAPEQQNVIDYTGKGGRMFATHYSYAWLYNDPPFSQTANWDLNASAWSSVEASIDTSLPVTQTFSSWMIGVGAALPNGQFNVQAPRHDFDSVVAPAVRYVFTPDHESFPLQYTFDTPYGSANTCGRVIFSDFHVTSNTTTSGTQFPNECSVGPMTPQEKALEYLLWDLAACVPVGPCTKLTCAEQNIHCGPAGDGCGGSLDCGPCAPPPDGCVPETCAQQNLGCGPAGDGCGNVIECGACQAPASCGGCGQVGVCCAPDSSIMCPALTCNQQNIHCGPAGDGCGHPIDCGSCPPPQTCGGGGVNGVCGAPPDASTGPCMPKTCAEMGVQCGYAGDGCGGLAGAGADPPTCGTCGPSQSCVSGKCQVTDAGCTKVSCAQQGIFCGPAGDGCGSLQDCGTCMAPQTCGGGGSPGVCGGGAS